MSFWRYINDFLRLSCAVDLLPRFAKAKNPAKEITESNSAFLHAVRHLKNLRRAPGDPRSWSDVVTFVPGDGSLALTSHVVVYRSRWSAVAIDPKPPAPTQAKRFRYVQARVEEFDPLFFLRDASVVVVLAVHSHAPLEPLVNKLVSAGHPVLVVAIPCCVQQELSWTEPIYDQRDGAIWSPQNRVLVWSIAE